MGCLGDQQVFCQTCQAPPGDFRPGKIVHMLAPRPSPLYMPPPLAARCPGSRSLYNSAKSTLDPPPMPLPVCSDTGCDPPPCWVPFLTCIPQARTSAYETALENATSDEEREAIMACLSALAEANTTELLDDVEEKFRLVQTRRRGRGRERKNEKGKFQGEILQSEGVEGRARGRAAAG